MCNQTLMSRLRTVAPTRCVFFLCKFPEEEDVDENHHAEEPDNPQNHRCYHEWTAISCKITHFQHFNHILVLSLNMRHGNHIMRFQIKTFTSDCHWHKLCDILLNHMIWTRSRTCDILPMWTCRSYTVSPGVRINYLLDVTWRLKGIAIDFDCSKHSILPENALTWGMWLHKRGLRSRLWRMWHHVGGMWPHYQRMCPHVGGIRFHVW